MKNNIELEFRGKLDGAEYNELKSKLSEKGNHIKDKKRFSFIYYPIGDIDYSALDNPIDIRLRFTNNEGELIMKYGEIDGADARKEYSIPVCEENASDVIEFLKVLGYYYGVIQVTKTEVFELENIEFALVCVPGWGTYFEAEVMVNEENKGAIEQVVLNKLVDLNLGVLDKKDYFKMLDEMSERDGFKFNFKEGSFERFKEKYADFF